MSNCIEDTSPMKILGIQQAGEIQMTEMKNKEVAGLLSLTSDCGVELTNQ